MNRLSLIEFGYFAKELPPCFTTKKFAIEFDAIMAEVEKHSSHLSKLLTDVRKTKGLGKEEEIRIKTDFNNKLSYSACMVYSIPKLGLSRKEIKIPNPLQQGKLVKTIENHFPEIEKIYAKSSLSLTKPKENSDLGKGKRAVVHSTYTEFKQKCILSTFHMRVQLKTDISKFYHSLYTHVIPWTTEGKQSYKKNLSLNDSDPRKKKNIYGDSIDRNLSNCQSKQTKGIPIGPDTSLVVAEIVSCHIDFLFQEALKKRRIDYKGYRYIDDYYLYFHSSAEAETAFDILGKTLTDFELEVNHEKTGIQVNPFRIEVDWAMSLKSYYFRPTIEGQKDDIWNFFALAFHHAKNNPSDNVLRFSLMKFMFVRIEKENWEMFESLLLRVGLVEPSTLQIIAKILITYKSLASKRRIKEFTYELIRRHASTNHDYEMTWALWLIQQFNIQVRKDILGLVFQSHSPSAILILLSVLQKKKIRTDVKQILAQITDDNLVTSNWLLVYEIALRGWLGVSSNTIDDNFFFGILKNKGVSFYDENETLEPINVQKNMYSKIVAKLSQVQKVQKEIKHKNKQISKSVDAVVQLFDLNNQKMDAVAAQNKLLESDQKITRLISQLSALQEKTDEFENKRPYFVLEKRLEELQNLAQKELASRNQEQENLLFDPSYE